MLDLRGVGQRHPQADLRPGIGRAQIAAETPVVVRVDAVVRQDRQGRRRVQPLRPHPAVDLDGRMDVIGEPGGELVGVEVRVRACIAEGGGKAALPVMGVGRIGLVEGDEPGQPVVELEIALQRRVEGPEVLQQIAGVPVDKPASQSQRLVAALAVEVGGGIGEAHLPVGPVLVEDPHEGGHRMLQRRGKGCAGQNERDAGRQRAETEPNRSLHRRYPPKSILCRTSGNIWPAGPAAGQDLRRGRQFDCADRLFGAKRPPDRLRLAAQRKRRGRPGRALWRICHGCDDQALDLIASSEVSRIASASALSPQPMTLTHLPASRSL